MPVVHVAVAAIVNSQQQVLIAQRPEHVHQGGLWEFPGGKVENGEQVDDALKREILEELGLHVDAMSPLIQVTHDYGDRSVLLDVWRVDRFHGEPEGLEGQPIRWLGIDDLDPEQFPAANKSIIRALQLPDRYMITGDFDGPDDFDARLSMALENGIRLVQLRTKQSTDSNDYIELANRAYDRCQGIGARLLLNTTPSLYDRCSAHGLHLNSRRLFDFSHRPIPDGQLLSVSCHDERELRQAEAVSADLVLLSPVRATSSHPGVPGMGWDAFRRLVRTIECPVYALGGMDMHDLPDAKNAGAQGIAAITTLWKP